MRPVSKQRGYKYIESTKTERLQVYRIYKNLNADAFKRDDDQIPFIYLLCHIYPGVPHQCAALFSMGLLHVT